MNILFHTYVINKTYTLVSYLSFGAITEETKSVLDGRTWDTSFFYMLSNKETVKGMDENARKFIVENYGWDEIAKKTENIKR